jgi:hypothetical protein
VQEKFGNSGKKRFDSAERRSLETSKRRTRSEMPLQRLPGKAPAKQSEKAETRPAEESRDTEFLCSQIEREGLVSKTRIGIVVLLLLGMCGIGKAQTCQIQIASAAPPNAVTLSDRLSGSAVSPNLILNNSGYGERLYQLDTSVAAKQLPANTDFSEVAKLPSLTGGGTAPLEGLYANFASGRLGNYFLVYLSQVYPNINTVYFDVGVKNLNQTLSWSHKGSQSVSGANLTLKIARVGTTLTAYVATDNVNFLAVGSVIGVNTSQVSHVGIFGGGGNDDSLVHTTFANVLLNGVFPTDLIFTPALLASYPGSLQTGEVTQGGTLTFGPDTASGASTLTIVGNCTPQQITDDQNIIAGTTAELNYQILVLDHLGSPVLAVNYLSPGVCGTCFASVTSSQASITLVHGETYTLTKTVHVAFIDGGVWGSYNPIVEVIPLNP